MKSDGRTASVVGCGLIGASWAALFAAYGLDVRAWDPDPDARARLPERMARPLAQLAEIGAGAAARGRLDVCDTLEDALRGAALIQENAPEDAALKRDLHRRIEAAAEPDAIIASSASALPWSALAEGMERPERLVTAHPFNPPHLIPLVELYGRDDAVLDRAEAFYRGLGARPIRLRRDAVGHVANRLASALWREAVHIVAEGIADVSAVDAAMVHGPGLRWSVLGAHMAYHLGGGPGGIADYLRHLGPSQERRWQSLGAPALTPEVREKLIAGIAEEAAGFSVAELEERRDRRLIALRKLRAEWDDL